MLLPLDLERSGGWARRKGGVRPERLGQTWFVSESCEGSAEDRGLVLTNGGFYGLAVADLGTDSRFVYCK